MSPSPDTNSAFVFGLDGAPWDLIKKWAESGELPNFNTIITEGVSGPLESTIPPTTPVAWPSIASGVTAGKHGIYSFRRLTSDYRYEINTSADIRQPLLWDICSPSVVGNVPMTYPPKEIDGEMVTGMMTPSLEGEFTHPPELADKIRTRIPEYEIGLNWSSYLGKEETFINDLHELLKNRYRLMKLLFENDEWELFFFVYTSPDRLQHLIWEEDVLLDYYKRLDDIVGEVLEYVQDHGAVLYVVSDHGFGPVSENVHVNTILKNEGYLETSGKKSRSALSRAGITKDRVLGVLESVNAKDAALSYVPDAIIRDIATRVPGEHGLFDVDISSTEAIAHEYGLIYINDDERFDEGVVPADHRHALKDEIVAALDSDEGPESYRSLLRVYDGMELFPNDTDGPDIVVVVKDGYEISTAIAEEVLTPLPEKGATHRKQGIYFAWGDDIRHETFDTGFSVYDVAPTLLHGLGKAIPENGDGQVRKEIFERTSKPYDATVETTSYTRKSRSGERDDDFEDVESRLRGLGYID
ncbi:alkaline phosphatase family protein [Natronorubrum sp. DTA28]|uniref:alkaline phosphatase family protein n=1 Tax=Natronorubrum sp. DTA28 TaxID=3447019 RepID=UPI003F87B100